MSRRGHGMLMRPSSNPSVTIGLTVTTSSPTLDLSSAEPFHVVVQARILSTPHPEQGIAMTTFLNPLDPDALCNRSFENIKCLTTDGKLIKNFPISWLQWLWDTEDLRSSCTWISIPPRDDVFTIKHELPRELIDTANPQKGEKYVVKIGDRCLGTRWWNYGSLEDLEGVRLRLWYDVAAREEEERAQPSLTGLRAREYEEVIERLGDGRTSIGENPKMLALVRENEEGAEFEIV